MDFNLNIGDQIVKNNGIFTIYKIENQQKTEDQEAVIFYYKPYFQTPRNNTLRCKIPASSLSLINIRKPVSKKIIKDFFKILAEELKNDLEETKINLNHVQDKLKQNDGIRNLAKPLARLWLEKCDKKVNFTHSKRQVFDAMISCLKEEVALVLNMNLEKAQEKIFLTLEEETPQVENG